MSERPYRTHARVFFGDGTVVYAAYDAGASLVDAALFESMDGIGTSDRADLADRSCHVPKGPDDLRAVHARQGTAVVPLSACEKVVVEASDHHGAHWWTGLAFRRGLVLATNRDGSEVYLKNDGLFRPHPLHEGMAREFPVTGVPFAEVDFRDLDSERSEPEGVDVPALFRR